MQRCGGVVVHDVAGPGGHPLTGYGPERALTVPWARQAGLAAGTQSLPPVHLPLTLALSCRPYSAETLKSTPASRTRPAACPRPRVSSPRYAGWGWGQHAWVLSYSIRPSPRL